MVLAGEKCERIMADKIRNVEGRDLECDELWSYIGKKQKRVQPEDSQLSVMLTLDGIERHTKLMLNIAMGKRDQDTTQSFVEGIRQATSRTPFQITTDGFAPYRSAITTTLHDRITGFAQPIKVYRAARRARLAILLLRYRSVEVVPVYGQPDPERICTA